MNETITQEALDGEALSRARKLVSELERGNTSQAAEIIRSLSGLCESSLYRQLVRLTRELHQSLEGFKLDSRIAALTESEMPDARERLNYVMQLTEQAAHRTLGAAQGPHVPGVDEPGVVEDQDDVDDLLSKLGI